MNSKSIPISVFSTCDRSREIWSQLNELRGVFTSDLWQDGDLKRLWDRLERLRDDLAMHYAHEWGGTGALHQASHTWAVPRVKLSLFLQEQTQIYVLSSELAEAVEKMVHAKSVSAAMSRSVKDRFKVFDALLISHESRKSMALHGR